MNAKLYRVILPVSDVNAAARFYASIFDDEGVRVSAGRHYFNCGGTILACFDAAADGDPQPTTPNPEWLYFSVPDIEKTFDVCRRAGAEMSSGDVHATPAGEIHVRPWGERSFYCEDPFGNKICFVDESTRFIGE